GSEEWTTQCEQLKTNFGSWQSFDLSETVRCSAPAVLICADGSGHFAQGNLEMGVAVLLENEHARLVSMSFKAMDGDWKHVPSRPPSTIYFDPPVWKAVRKSSGLIPVTGHQIGT